MNNLSKWYPDGIDYTVSFTMVDSNGDSAKVTAPEMGSRTVQLIKVSEDGAETPLETLRASALSFTSSTQTLEYDAEKSSENHYILRFSSDWDLDDDTEICVQTVATPVNGGDTSKYSDLSSLGAIIGLRRTKSGESTGWQAYLAEESDNLDVSKCDGYNLVVTGSGAAKITIKWNAEKLACNKNFHDGTIYSFGSGEVTYTAPESGDTIATLVINADTGSSATNNRNRYDIQFYKTGAEPSNWTFFKDVSNEANGAPDGNVWLTVAIEQ